MTFVERRKNLGLLLLVAAVMIALGTSVAGAAGSGGNPQRGPTGKLLAGAEERVLRLTDLPRAYQLGEDGACFPLVPGEGVDEPLARLIVKYWPEGCELEYERLFELPRSRIAPPLVTAAVLNFPSARGAAALWDLLNNPKSNEDGTRYLPVSTNFGDVSDAYRTEQNILGKTGPATGVLWRDGAILAWVQVGGESPPRNLEIALELAAVQQSRVEAPTPFAAEEQRDATVPLDDPALPLPIYWLGERFAPGNGLPVSDLEEAFTTLEPGTGPPGSKVTLGYQGFTEFIFTRAGWKAFQRSQLGPLNRRRKCDESTRVPLADGSAVVFAGYAKDHRICPDRPPNRFFAVARLGGTVVAINPVICTKCVQASSGPYASVRAMKEVVRGLELRTKSVY